MGYFKYIWIFLIRGFTLFANLLLAYTVTTNLSDKDQGVYYTLQSLAAMQFFFDLGISFVLSNYAAQKIKISATFNKNSVLTSESVDEIKAIIKFTLAWTLIAGLLMFIFTTYLGENILFTHQTIESKWWVYMLFISANIALNALLSILEGIGQVNTASLMRFIQSLIYVLLFYTLTIFSNDVFSIIYAYAFSYCLTVISLFYFYKNQIYQIYTLKTKSKVNWYKDILPFQWQVALSWIAGYFIFQYLTIVLTANDNLIDAGKFGLTSQIIQSINSLVSIILVLKISQWSYLNSHKEHRKLESDYAKTVITTVTLVCLINTLLYIVIYKINIIPLYYQERILEDKYFIYLFIASIFNQIFFCTSYYFRSKLHDPLWKVSILSAIIIIIITFFEENISIDLAVKIFLLSSILLMTGSLLEYHKSFLKKKKEFLYEKNTNQSYKKS